METRETFRKGDLVKVNGNDGIAYHVVEGDHERSQVVMVGDDRIWEVYNDTITHLGPGMYCGECGQIGCGWH